MEPVYITVVKTIGGFTVESSNQNDGQTVIFTSLQKAMKYVRDSLADAVEVEPETL
jgi:hypothetical protein